MRVQTGVAAFLSHYVIIQLTQRPIQVPHQDENVDPLPFVQLRRRVQTFLRHGGRRLVAH